MRLIYLFPYRSTGRVCLLAAKLDAWKSLVGASCLGMSVKSKFLVAVDLERCLNMFVFMLLSLD
jgi:hypothetical protein